MSLTKPGLTGQLWFASLACLTLLGGMVLSLILALLLIVDSVRPEIGLLLALAITLAVNGLGFLLAPFLMDWIQAWLYKTRWVTTEELKASSPQSLAILQRICQERRISMPRLGIIDDDNPTAFTYGSLPSHARIVVSRGLFHYLDDDEVAAVYSHELGHIVHWDFAVMTLAASLVQVAYLIYVAGETFSSNVDDNSGATGWISAVAFVFYELGSFLLLYLSRVREYFADQFSATVTGNPNALSRALVKIAYGIVQEQQRLNQQPQAAKQSRSRLLEGTRALGVVDPRAALSTGTAFGINANPEVITQVFLWDLFNPWAWWQELASTHPLTAKRILALSTTAERMGRTAEFDMAQVIQAGRRLDQRLLLVRFSQDLLVANAAWVLALLGLFLGLGSGRMTISLGWMSLGLSLGLLLQVSYFDPLSKQPEACDVLSLLSDPYASPVRGRLVSLKGELIGRANAGNRWSADMELRDGTGLISLRYAALVPLVGALITARRRVPKLIGSEVTSVGWFRRGVAPWIDLRHLHVDRHGVTLHSYPRVGLLVLSLLFLLIGCFGVFWR